MGRKRKDGQGLPKYVYRKRGWYALRVKQDGALKGWVNLAPADAPISEVWKAYEDLQGSAHNLRALMSSYLEENRRLAPRTRADYEDYARLLAEAPLKGGRVFGDIDAAAVKPQHVRAYLDRHAGTPIAANRRVQFLKAAYAWAYERGRVSANPCHGVKLHPQQARTRYVTDEEYEATLGLAQRWADAGRYPYLWIAMECAYLLRARRAEVLALRRDQIQAGRITWPRTKGSRPESTEITPRLRVAIEAGKRLDADIASPLLIHSKGQAIRKNAFDSAWQRLMARAIEEGLIGERYTFHDLKAKGASDHEDHHTGHRSERARDVYLRRPDEVKATR